MAQTDLLTMPVFHGAWACAEIFPADVGAEFALLCSIQDRYLKLIQYPSSPRVTTAYARADGVGIRQECKLVPHRKETRGYNHLAKAAHCAPHGGSLRIRGAVLPARISETNN